MSIWFWPFLSSCILTWPVTIMNHPKDAWKEAQRQSATSHRPGVRKVEKGQFKMPIGYTTQMKSLFHIHSYPSLKNLPLRFDLPKSKTIHQNIYPKWFKWSTALDDFASQIIHSGPGVQDPWRSHHHCMHDTLVETTSTGETKSRGFQRRECRERGSKLLKDTFRWESRPQPHWTTSTPNTGRFENLVMNMGTLAWGPTSMVGNAREPGVISLIGV